MKRSELNAVLREAVVFLEARSFNLPPFAFWSPADWRSRGREYDEIREEMLGWDVTDFGSGRFSGIGLLMFTLRNGAHPRMPSPKSYAEKILITQEGQVTPFHFHWNKMEDIINRGGGNLLVKVHASGPDGCLADSDVPVSMDGRNHSVKAGTVLRVCPGESITLIPGQYHTFWAEKGTGTVLLGEVSKVNDDRTDNRFLDKVGRFPQIEEDEPPLYLLCNEYPAASA
jgi:hypothetical protein